MKISKDVQLATQQLMTQLKRAENPYAQVTSGDQAPIDKEPAVLSEGSQQAIALIKTSGLPMDAQTQQAVSNFMDQAPGTVKEKLEALATALAKDIPLKAEALNALRIAKTGSLADYLGPAAQPTERSARDQGASEIKRAEVRRPEAQRQQQILQETLSQLDTLLEAMLDTLSTEKGDKSVNYGDKSVFKGENIGIIPAPYVDKTVDSPQGVPDREGIITKSPPAMESKIDQAVQAKALDISKGLMALEDETSQGVQSLEPEAPQNEAASPIEVELTAALEALSEMVSQLAPEDLVSSTGLGDQVRMLLEQKVTPRLLAVKEHFKAQVKTIAEQLNRVMEKSDPTQGKQLTQQERVIQLDKIIDQLDQLVMKSEASLFLSLKGEKRLIALSAQVDSAKQQLMKGALPEAERLVKTVVESLSQMKLEPTLKRVLGLPSFGNATDLEGLSKAYAVGNDRFASGEKSAVGILNFLRKLGLNHEPELYQKAFGQEFSVDPTGPSLKEKLIKLSQQGAMGSGPSEDGGGDALSHITGQQLGNRIVDKPQLQQMSFALPVGQGGVTHQMQVLIQTPQDRLKADWKTFDMVFMLSTPKVGDVGIKVRSVDLKLSVEIINDSVEREALFKPLVSAMMADLGDMGFTATSVTFKGWQGKGHGPGADRTQPNGQKDGLAEGQAMSLDQAKAAVKNAREGGFDIKI